MGTLQKNLDELVAQSSGYKVIVKIVEKSCPATGGLLHQNVLMQDQKGCRMWATLFGEQVALFGGTLKYNCKYEIVNAPIRVRSLDCGCASVGSYQMSFDDRTLITCLDKNRVADVREYTVLRRTPIGGCYGDKIDVVGAVLYVEAAARPVTIAVNRRVLVRELVVADQSSGRPLIVCVCNNLAKHDVEAIASVQGELRVVGFTALRTSSYKGFSLRATTETELRLEPVGTRAQELREWVADNKGALLEQRERARRLFEVRDYRVTVSIASLKLIKADMSWQYDCSWLRVTRVKVNMWKLIAYIGCSSCSKRVNTRLGGKSRCRYCRVRDSTATHMLVFNCHVYDGTGELSLTMRTAETSALFGLAPAQIYSLRKTRNLGAFADIHNRLKETSVVIRVAPSSLLTRNNILWWRAKALLIDEDENLVAGTTAAVEENQIGPRKRKRD